MNSNSAVSAAIPPTRVRESERNNRLDDFADFLRHAQSLEHAGKDVQTLRAWLELAEAYRITQALHECRGNRSAAARLLGIGRRTLYAKMEKLGITPTWSVRG